MSQKKKEKKLSISEVRKIKKLHKVQIENWKKEWKKKISNEKDPVKKKTLQEEYKNFFKKWEVEMPKDTIIKIDKVEKYYLTNQKFEHVLRGVSFEIKEGEMVTILGPSGSGKSTLLNIISGLLQADKGSIMVDGKELFAFNERERTKFRADKLSFVFQSYNLIQTLTALENIKIGENLRPKDRKKIEISKILKTLDLTNYAKKYPYQLSGGQNQRVSLGRALSKNPRILFADEPTGALDIEKSMDVLKLLVDINKKFKTTILMVTHNTNISQISDKIIKLRDGKIEKIIINKNKKEISQVKWT